MAPTFEVPASKASLDQNRFKFKFPGGKKVYTVPLLQYMKPALALKLDEAPNDAAAARILFAEYLPEALDHFEDGEQLQAFVAAWQDASGVSVGESKASDES